MFEKIRALVYSTHTHTHIIKIRTTISQLLRSDSLSLSLSIFFPPLLLVFSFLPSSVVFSLPSLSSPCAIYTGVLCEYGGSSLTFRLITLPLMLLTHTPNHAFIHPLSRLLTHPFIRSCTHLLVYPPSRTLIDLLTRLSIHSHTLSVKYTITFSFTSTQVSRHSLTHSSVFPLSLMRSVTFNTPNHSCLLPSHIQMDLAHQRCHSCTYIHIRTFTCTYVHSRSCL